MSAIKDWFTKVVTKMGVSKVKKKSPILKALLDDPESVKVEAYIENDEIVVKIKKKEES